jgi:hypothetical protein
MKDIRVCKGEQLNTDIIYYEEYYDFPQDGYMDRTESEK